MTNNDNDNDNDNDGGSTPAGPSWLKVVLDAANELRQEGHAYDILSRVLDVGTLRSGGPDEVFRSLVLTECWPVEGAARVWAALGEVDVEDSPADMGTAEIVSELALLVAKTTTRMDATVERLLATLESSEQHAVVDVEGPTDHPGVRCTRTFGSALRSGGRVVTAPARCVRPQGHEGQCRTK